MKQTFSGEKLAEIYSKLENSDSAFILQPLSFRAPVHVVYGGAHLFTAETPQKLGTLALKSLDEHAPNFMEFSKAMWLKGADVLPNYEDAIADLAYQFIEREEKLKRENFAAWFALTVYRKTIDKLRREPIEDFRIDFEDGYGFRTDAEEDEHTISASDELAKLVGARTSLSASDSRAISPRSNLPFCGFRIKSFQKETFKRAIRTLDLFLTNFLEKTNGELPDNFVVTLPKIRRCEEVENLNELLSDVEKQNALENGAIKIEIMIETPEAIVNEKGEINLRNLVEAGKGRVNSAHFGAFDYTASFGISGTHQHLRHEACNFARQMMQISLAPLGIRLSDSVTTEMPIAVHKGENLSDKLRVQNKRAVHSAWRKHFNNVTLSLIDGFYQSWDLHPAQLVARYAAVYSFFLDAKDEQARRLKGFVEKATQAMTTGNIFDDAASAQGLLNFFLRALNCGAIEKQEILEITGLSENELRSASFMEIMESRRKPGAAANG
jgi:hypothetical protein